MIEFKKEFTGVTDPSPDEILIYAKPKLGKTDLVSRLPDCGIIDLEKGSKKVAGYKHEVNNLEELDAVLTWLEKENPYQFVAFDTMTRLAEWCEIQGTIDYMKSTQGKTFNRVKQEHIKSHGIPAAKLGQPFPVGHELFESVETLPNGYGYRWSRECYKKWFLRMRALPCKKIFVAHIKDKFIETKSGETVEGRDIDLTGKLKGITTSFCDTIAYLNRQDDGNTYLSFQAGEKVAEGSRSKHLTGQNILVGEWDKTKNDYSKVHWNKIFLELKK